MRFLIGKYALQIQILQQDCNGKRISTLVLRNCYSNLDLAEAEWEQNFS